MICPLNGFTRFSCSASATRLNILNNMSVKNFENCARAAEKIMCLSLAVYTINHCDARCASACKYVSRVIVRQSGAGAATKALCSGVRLRRAPSTRHWRAQPYRNAWPQQQLGAADTQRPAPTAPLEGGPYGKDAVRHRPTCLVETGSSLLHSVCACACVCVCVCVCV